MVAEIERTIVVTIKLPLTEHAALGRAAKAAGRSMRMQAARFIADGLRREGSDLGGRREIAGVGAVPAGEAETH